MDPKIIHGIAVGVRLAATFGVSRIVKGFAVTQAPPITTLDKVLIAAGSWGISGLINERVGPYADEQVQIAADNLVKIKDALNKPNLQSVD